MESPERRRLGLRRLLSLCRSPRRPALAAAIPSESRKGMEGNLDSLAAGKNPVATKAGDWNRFELTVRGATASLTVNGQRAWQVDGLEELDSYISLQAEVPGGGQFLFRNIRLTELKGS